VQVEDVGDGNSHRLGIGIHNRKKQKARSAEANRAITLTYDCAHPI
jgi:hypothetical protein